MRTNKHKLLAALSLTMTSVLVISCTKEVPYKEVYKEKVHTKSEVDASAEYLYVASSDTSSSDDLGAANAIPFWQGQEKIVKFRFTENSLQAVEVSEESRLTKSSVNEKIAFEIPVKHVEYRCAEDRYQKCTNREEENSEINWSKKNKFIPNFDQMKTVGLSLLPIEMDKVFGGSCYSEVASRFLNYDLTADALNIQVEKSFVADLSCLARKGINISKLSDAQTQIVYHYSFVKLNTMASPNYKAVAYPSADENAFGFFNTEYNRYDVDFNRLEKGKQVYLNRWNPDRKEIVYYLSDNFEKPEFATIKKSTETAFERVNNGLKAAGISTRLVLKGAAHKQPGDVRNSMIVLIEDPIASGPLGYGPTVSHPRTGEIMSGRVAMYYGNLLQNIKYTYDEVRRELKYTKENKVAAAAKVETVSQGLKQDLQVASYLNKAVSNKISKKTAATYTHTVRPHAAANQFTKVASIEKLSKMTINEFSKATRETSKSSASEDVLAAMSKHCNYPAELFPFDEAVKNGLQSKLGEELKPWENLSAKEKQEIIDLIAPEIWLPTLVHEIGHNLGLRHNFGGSEDKENFYSKEELAKMSVKHEIPYSSVMDYGYSELNLLPTLGKYDIAALRFAYTREVVNTKGEMLKVNTTLKDLKAKLGEKEDSDSAIKSFKYCSDEHVDVNPDCKRFDKGTNLTEIAEFMVKQYNEMYERRNKRNGRESFSAMSDAAYAAATRARFGHLRAFMERYETMKYALREGDSSKYFVEIPWLKDLKSAALISGRFFLDVLKTPDLLCMMAPIKNPTQVQPVALGADQYDCFSADWNPEYMVVAQMGKSFNHRKDRKSDNHYADQIDTRGIYIDKMMAAEALFARRTGNSIYDKNEDNYLDIADLAEEITTTIDGLMTNSVQTKVDFINAEGQILGSAMAPVKSFSAPNEKRAGEGTHWISAPLDDSIARYLGLPMSAVSFQEVLLKTMDRHMSKSKDHALEDKGFMDQYRVYKASKAAVLEKAGTAIKDIGSQRFFAVEDNIMGNEVIKMSKQLEALSELSEDEIVRLYNERAANDAQILSGSKSVLAPLDTSFSKELAEIPAAIIVGYKTGRLSAEGMNYLMTILPEAQ